MKRLALVATALVPLTAYGWDQLDDPAGPGSEVEERFEFEDHRAPRYGWEPPLDASKIGLYAEEQIVIGGDAGMLFHTAVVNQRNFRRTGFIMEPGTWAEVLDGGIISAHSIRITDPYYFHVTPREGSAEAYSRFLDADLPEWMTHYREYTYPNIDKSDLPPFHSADLSEVRSALTSPRDGHFLESANYWVVEAGDEQTYRVGYDNPILNGAEPYNFGTVIISGIVQLEGDGAMDWRIRDRLVVDGRLGNRLYDGLSQNSAQNLIIYVEGEDTEDGPAVLLRKGFYGAIYAPNGTIRIEGGGGGGTLYAKNIEFTSGEFVYRPRSIHKCMADPQPDCDASIAATVPE
jgi:hypothetical protein